MDATEAQPLFTIGHSTRELDEFIGLLRTHGITRIVDVRRYPGSRRYPHFGSEALRDSLRAAGIDYRHAPDLGGRRRPAADSPNTYWRNDSFRAYADYMATPEFRAALDRLVSDVADAPTAVMCAEAVPWRCHRNLISDAVAARGVGVLHVVDENPPKAHALSEGARVADDGTVWYPGADAEEAAEQGSLEL
ncbi:MAG TPA: DUF488 domain-containing protein [Longimicrobiales bacterium]